MNQVSRWYDCEICGKKLNGYPNYMNHKTALHRVKIANGLTWYGVKSE